MFSGATAFDQNLLDWNVTKVTKHVGFMKDTAGGTEPKWSAP
jgi:hypothetical protein